MSKRIEELIKEQETISNKALKEALAEQIAAEEEKQKKLLLGHFNGIRESLDQEVSYLRILRKKERDQIKRVTLIDTAFTAFKKTGDIEAFEKATKDV